MQKVHFSTIKQSQVDFRKDVPYGMSGARATVTIEHDKDDPAYRYMTVTFGGRSTDIRSRDLPTAIKALITALEAALKHLATETSTPKV